MKLLLLFTLLCATLSANELLLKEAQKYEDNGEYKKAMQIYKELAYENRKVDDVTQEQIDYIRTKLNKSNNKQTNATIEQMLSSSFNISAYKENYFLPISHDLDARTNREQNEAKFQLSIKKPIRYNLLGLNETINFGYTQTSWWQIYSQSAPFRESNYKPEIFLFAPYKSLEKTALKAYKIGLIHESNGQGGLDSRSWNRAYLEGYFQLSNLFLIPRVWYRIPEKAAEDDNPDIEDYLGYGDLNLLYAHNKHTFKLLLRNNLKLDNDNKGFAELNWSFPLFNSKDSFGFLQISSGYGDSLIDYDKSVDRIGFGISLSR